MKHPLPLALPLLFSLACGGLTSTTDPTEGPAATDPPPDEIVPPNDAQAAMAPPYDYDAQAQMAPPEGPVGRTKRGELWGLTDSTGRWVSAPIYERILRDGPLWVGEREGVVADLLLPPRTIQTPCKSITWFSSEGIAGCHDDGSGRWALIDREGKLTTPPIWTRLTGPHTGATFYVCYDEYRRRCKMVDSAGLNRWDWELVGHESSKHEIRDSTDQILAGPNATIKVFGPDRIAIGVATDRFTEVYGPFNADQRRVLVKSALSAWRIVDAELNEVLDCGDYEPVAASGSLAVAITHDPAQTVGVRGPDGWIWRPSADLANMQRGAFLSEDLVAVGHESPHFPSDSVKWTLVALPTGLTSDSFWSDTIPRLSYGRIATSIDGTCGWLDRHGNKVAGFEPGMEHCSDWEDGQGTSSGADGERIWRL